MKNLGKVIIESFELGRLNQLVRSQKNIARNLCRYTLVVQFLQLKYILQKCSTFQNLATLQMYKSWNVLPTTSQKKSKKYSDHTFDFKFLDLFLVRSKMWQFGNTVKSTYLILVTKFLHCKTQLGNFGDKISNLVKHCKMHLPNFGVRISNLATL